MPYSPETEVKHNGALRGILRHKGKALGFFALSLAVAVIATMAYPRTYRSEAKLFLRLGRENTTIDPTATLGKEAIAAMPMTRETETFSVVELLMSRSLSEQVVDHLGPQAILHDGSPSPVGGAAAENWWLQQASDVWQKAADVAATLRLRTALSDREKAIIRVGKQLSVVPVKKSDVISVAYEGRTPETAQAVLAQLTDAYLAEHARIHRSSRVHEFLEEQTGKLRTQLAHTQADLRDLKTKTGLAAPEVTRSLIATRISRLEDDLASKRVAVAASTARLQRLREILAAEPEQQLVASEKGIGNQGTDLMRGQLYSLRMQEQAAAAKYTEMHPLLQEITRQSAEAKKILDGEEPVREQVTTGPGRGFEQARLAILTEEPNKASLAAESDSLQTQLAVAHEDLKAFNENDLRVAELQCEVDLQLAAYRKYAESMEQTRIDSALENERICNVSVAQAATLNPMPVHPNVAMNLLLGLFVGIAGGIAVAWLAESMDHTFKHEGDVEDKLELPVLMSVPRWKRKQLAASGRN